MAKTLIGNIKGKNGRGITSIKKTGTTGSVDTYTITYTDSTTSTFTVNNSDSIVLQRQIVPSAAVESSDTASQAYAAGDYVAVNGVLRKVTSSIAKGSTIGASNSTATTVAGEIKTLCDSVSQTVVLYDSGDGICTAKMAGGIVVVSCDMIPIPEGMKTVKLGVLPEEMRPVKTAIGAAYARGINSYGQITVADDGVVGAWCSVSTSGFFGGCVSYPAK